MNKTIFSFVFAIASTVCMGVFVALALITQHTTMWHIIAAVVAGLMLSIPISAVVAKKLGA